MCGIAGKLDTRGQIPEDLIHRMCETIVHRGPDSRGVHTEEGLALGIQRLAVIDLATGEQPIYNEDRSIVLILNGEIYNYRELRDGLRRRGHRFATETDTEVIVHLYEEQGVDCVDELRGMFAFAIWDRNRRRLMLARDRVGKKPLFYREADGALWFGSEVRSLLEDRAVPREINPEAVDAFLQFQYVPHPVSAFAGISKLPPAHVLTWEQGRVDLRRYWRLSYRDKIHAEPEALREEIRTQLREAVHLRMRSDVPLGAFLSGGVDSSAVVAAMAMDSAEPIRTFSIGFDVASFDETHYARMVAERYATEHHEFRVEPEALDLLPRMVWHYGEPFADSSAIPSFVLAELTRRHVTVALNGDGGDEAFAGYVRYRAMVTAGRLDRLGDLRRALAWGADRVGPGRDAGTIRSRAVRAASALGADPCQRYRDWMSFFRNTEAEAVFTREFSELLGADPLAGRWLADPWNASDATNVVDRLLDVDTNTYLPADLLVKMDIATMAHSLEVRSPFLDHVLLERAAAIPASQKLAGTSGKHVLKEAVRPWLPDELIDRPKMGFGVPIGAWFRGPLSALPGEILLDPRATARGILRTDRVRGLIEEHRTGVRDHAGKIWALLQLELWMRMFIDGDWRSHPEPSGAVDALSPRHA